MKKLFVTVSLAIAALLVLRVIRSSDQSALDHQKSGEAAAPAPGEQARRAVPGPAVASPAATMPDWIAEVRAALAANDRDALDRAYAGLIGYINAHPEQVDDYVAFLKSEKEEHVLRAFARALAETEVGLLGNDRIIATALELARDGSFEQRQHIALHLIGNFPELREDVHAAVLEIARDDPNPQVKTSAVVVLADWMEHQPEQTEALLEDLGRIFDTAMDEDVRLFTYQLLAQHKERLPRERHAQLEARFRTEPDSFAGLLIAMALSAAPDDLRHSALRHAQRQFEAEADVERRRNYLAQIVFLAPKESIALLEKTSTGSSLVADDAREYLALVSAGALNPDQVLMNRAVRDAIATAREAHNEHH